VSVSETMVLMDAFVSVYVDWAATEDAVRTAIAELVLPTGVDRVEVFSSADTLGCRVAVELVGTFDPKTDGRRIARRYAGQLSEALDLPAFALDDLILSGRSEW
jgi:hypothetical protein